MTKQRPDDHNPGVMVSDTQHPIRLAQSERLARMRLARSANVGPVTFRKLIERFGSARNAIDALPDIIARTGGKRQIVLATREDTIAEIDQGRACDAKPVIIGDPEYPAMLAAIEDAPPYFYALGRVELLTRPTIGIVGARNASANGCGFARRLSAALCEAGYVVASGMARGIDGAVHDACLQVANTVGGTVAVLGGGVDVVYPREHADLYRKLCENGCVISEMPPGLNPQARHFPRRNRIISGLSHGIVVVEAGRNSGSLITARFAGEQGRDVFAVPGSPTDPRAAGPNSLIRDGAILCDSVDVILDALHVSLQNNHLREGIHHFAIDSRATIVNGQSDDFSDITKSIERDARTGTIDDSSESVDNQEETGVNDRSRNEGRGTEDVLELLSTSPLLIDQLIRASGMPADVISTMLIELELAGRVERHPGNRVSRIAE
ncbi:DNA-processing protein DprA [Thalassospira sp.]|uniref:DNA-processing protein DprA n=1 Tax=Thalassospira sp. TaxID=1912094 RepID=UPI0025F50013|nr:DNA-processing protein DprA [Thalassospira sp.]